jgi:hypothetical protein
MGWLLLANAASTWFMTGLIWFVQLVHYPQFPGVGTDGFTAYHRRHTRFTTYVVLPPMIVEAVTALWLALRPAPAIGGALAWLGLALVGVIWLSTFLLQVPRHNELGVGFDAAACARLCRTNWVRTIAWTLRAALVLLMLGLTIATGAAARG